MASLITRIRKRVITTMAAFRHDCTFSHKLAIYRVCDDLCWRLGLKRISKFFHMKKDRWIVTYLNENLREVVVGANDISECEGYKQDAPIWICWWTGESDAPELVKRCISSIRKNAGTHPVHLIDRTTYTRFLEIPDYMLNRVQTGQMGLAHLSDYIRVSVLEQYGGLWLDATIFCADTIREEFFEMPFYTCKSNPCSCRYVSQMRWTTFVLGGWKASPVFRYLKKAFEYYWCQEDTAVDYLFFDYLIEVGYQHIPSVRKMIDDVPINNLRRDDLQAAMNRAVSSREWDDIVCPDTVLYKLSWRETYSLTTPDGQDSIYTYFLKGEI